MKLIAKLILALLGNGLALIAAEYFVEGFTVSNQPKEFVTVVVILTLVNLIIRPIAKLILSPLILITLGLFALVINAGILYGIDIYFTEITISGLVPLILATLIVGAVNAILKFAAKVL